MSDKVQSDYTEYMDNVKPSEEFLSQLVQTLEDEQSGQRQGRRLFRAIPAAAACLILICCLLSVLYMRRPQGDATEQNTTPTSEEINNYAAAMTGEDTQTTPFSGSDWRDNVSLDESTPVALAQKLTLSLDYLSYNSENRFVDAETVDDTGISQIIELLQSAKPVDSKALGQRVYYMAVFTDGTIAKFNITDDGCVEIDGDKNIYKKTEK